MAPAQQLIENSHSPLETFDAQASALIGAQSLQHAENLELAVPPLIRTISQIRTLLSAVKIDDLKSIIELKDDNSSQKIGEILAHSEITEDVKEALRQMVTAFFIRITAVLSAPAPSKRGRPLGSKTNPLRVPSPSSEHSPSRREELIQQLKGPYVEAMTKTLEAYNATADEKIDLKQA